MTLLLGLDHSDSTFAYLVKRLLPQEDWWLSATARSLRIIDCVPHAAHPTLRLVYNREFALLAPSPPIPGHRHFILYIYEFLPRTGIL